MRRLVGSLVIVLAQAMLAGHVSAQLSAQDIDALRRRGEQEGWTFQVTENPATRRPLQELCGLKEPENFKVVRELAEALGAAMERLEPEPTGVGVFEIEDGSGLWEVGDEDGIEDWGLGNWEIGELGARDNFSA